MEQFKTKVYSILSSIIVTRANVIASNSPNTAFPKLLLFLERSKETLGGSLLDSVYQDIAADLYSPSFYSLNEFVILFLAI